MRLKIFLTIFIFVNLFFENRAVFGQIPLNAEQVISELNCASCHTGFNISSNLREKIPDLSYAGLRYNPAYLFDYLQHPGQVRRHIGLSRMPDFKLNEREALALTLFLETQTEEPGNWPAFPSELDKEIEKNERIDSPDRFKTIIRDSLICLTCHTYNQEGGSLAVDLAGIGYRLKSAWFKKYLTAPGVFGVPPTVMPHQFYQLSADRKEFVEIRPHAAGMIGRLADYLFILNKEKRAQFESAYGNAKKAYPEINAGSGKQIFIALNCSACHRHQTIEPMAESNAPDLSIEGLRVTEKWLNSFLKKPQPIRPFGHFPGSGSRMPDFRLSEEEVNIITAFLLLQKNAPSGFVPDFKPEKLSAFSLHKAELLLQNKLSCLGCHQLGGRGGKIGPDLSALDQRLQPAFVYNIIKNPREILPHTVMPKVPVPPDVAELIVNYLLQQQEEKIDSAYLSLLDNPIILPDHSGSRQDNYLKFCAPCHGREGKGDGFNARFLPVKPTVHSGGEYMSQRPDDTLFDGVFSGGYILNRSHLMPPWGKTLSFDEIKALVNYMRELCQCQGPEWSRDNR